MFSFINWYFARAPLAQLYTIAHIISYFEDLIGISVNIKFYFAPIFNDNSWFGRIMSLLFRTTVIVFGTIIISIIAIIFVFMPLIWFLSLVGWLFEPLVLIIPTLAIIYYLVYVRGESEHLYPFKKPFLSLEKFANKEAKAFLIPHYDQEYFQILLKSSSVTHILQRLLLSPTEFLSVIEHTSSIDPHQISATLRQVLTDYHIRQLRPVHVFFAHIINSQQQFLPLLSAHKIDIELIKKYIVWEEYENLLNHPPAIWDEDYKVHTSGGTNVTWQGTVTPILNQYSRDITMEALSSNIRVIRKDLITEIEQGLQKNMSASILLVGDIGVGKDTLVKIIAQEINKGNIRGFLWSKRIVQLDVGRLYAGATEKGIFENRVENIITEINRSSNIVMYLNDFKSALEISASGTISLFSLLQTPLSHNKLHIIGSVTPRQYQEIENANPGFIKEFTVVHVDEPNKDETTNILFNESLGFEEKHNVFFPYSVIEYIYETAHQYILDDHFPQKGIRLLQDVSASVSANRLNTTWNTKYGLRVPVLPETINKVISQKLHISVGDANPDESQRLLNLEQSFSKKIIGQTNAVKALSEVLRRNRLGLRNKNRPIGSFLFVGPTGVGKTKMAKVLAEEYYGSEDRMIRLDMSEFQTVESISRLIGNSSQGNSYLTLTEQLRKQPFSLVLLDELEKAHDTILDIFLQVLDDGRLTDAQGETVSCKEAIFIATSNAGTRTITDMFQKNTSPDSYETINKEIYHILSEYFRIEFLNRFDEIIIFKPLTPESLKKIVNIELEGIAKALYDEQKITVAFSPETVAQIIKQGYNPELGARPLERAVQTIVESQLARLMLEKKVIPGGSLTI